MLQQTDYNKWYYKILYFFIVNQIALKRGLIVFLIVVCAGLWSFGVFKWTNYILETGVHNTGINQAVSVDYSQLKKCQTLSSADFLFEPKALFVSDTSASAGFYGRRDFLVKVRNPNTDCYFSKIKYYFSYDGHHEKNRVYHEEFLMPGASKYLFSFSEEVDMPTLNNIKLELAEQDVSALGKGASVKENFAVFQNLSVADANFDSGAKSSSVTFTAKNNSNKDLWQIGYQVVVFSDSQKNNPEAASYVTANQFISGTSRQMQTSWFKDFGPFFPEVDVVVDANTFDSNIYWQRVFGPGASPREETD